MFWKHYAPCGSNKCSCIWIFQDVSGLLKFVTICFVKINLFSLKGNIQSCPEISSLVTKWFAHSTGPSQHSSSHVYKMVVSSVYLYAQERIWLKHPLLQSSFDICERQPHALVWYDFWSAGLLLFVYTALVGYREIHYNLTSTAWGDPLLPFLSSSDSSPSSNSSAFYAGAQCTSHSAECSKTCDCGSWLQRLKPEWYHGFHSICPEPVVIRVFT